MFSPGIYLLCSSSLWFVEVHPQVKAFLIKYHGDHTLYEKGEIEGRFKERSIGKKKFNYTRNLELIFWSEQQRNIENSR